MNNVLHKKDLLIVLIGCFGVGLLATAIYFTTGLHHAPVLGTTTIEDPQIAKLEIAIKDQKAPIETFTSLMSYYTQAVRETGNTAYYAEIDTVLEEAKNKFGSNNPDLMIAEAGLAIGRHDFIKAEALAALAIKANPNVVHYYGVHSDALIELGRYDEAGEALQTMVDIRPDYASYTRIAYVKELLGDTEGAVELMERAIASGSSIKEHIAWAEVEMGRLLFGTERAKAKSHFEKALISVPEYTQAYIWLGKVAYREGDKEKALDYFTKAYDIAPTITNAEALYSYAKAEGNTTDSTRYAKIIDAAYRISQRQGNIVNLEYGRFLMEEDNLAEAESYAKNAYETRPTIYSAELMAKVSLAKNDVSQARKFSDESLRLLTKDASLFYTRALIEKAAGDSEAMRTYAKAAFDLDSHFSIIHEKALSEMRL